MVKNDHYYLMTYSFIYSLIYSFIFKCDICKMDPLIVFFYILYITFLY